MERDIIALKMGGTVDPAAVMQLALIATASDYDGTTIFEPLEINEPRNNSTLELLAPMGLLVVRQVLKAEIKNIRSYNANFASPHELKQKASLEVTGCLSLPSRHLIDPDAIVSIHSNRGPDGDYYTMLARWCVLKPSGLE